MRNLILLGSLILLFSGAYAQNNPTMSANVGFGPGDSFTLFITLQEPMAQIDDLSCSFGKTSPVKPPQQDFSGGFACDPGRPQKDDDTHYHVHVSIPKQGIASGEYKLQEISFFVGQVRHQYVGDALPTLAAVTVKNPQQVKFATIKELKVQ